jgi:hypothetical protein
MSVQYETHLCSKLLIAVNEEGNYSGSKGRVFLLDYLPLLSGEGRTLEKRSQGRVKGNYRTRQN